MAANPLAPMVALAPFRACALEPVRANTSRHTQSIRKHAGNLVAAARYAQGMLRQLVRTEDCVLAQ